MLSVTLFATMCVSALGHMCLLAPYQRPGYVNDSSLTTPGDGACALTTGPCGGVAAKTLNAAIMSEVQTVVMLKNLDHFNKAAPGNFTVALWSSAGDFIRNLGSVMDDARPAGSLYQVGVPIPHEGGESKFIIQTAYYPNNANAPAAFYQCADIEVFPRD